MITPVRLGEQYLTVYHRIRRPYPGQSALAVAGAPCEELLRRVPGATMPRTSRCRCLASRMTATSTSPRVTFPLQATCCYRHLVLHMHANVHDALIPDNAPPSLRDVRANMASLTYR